MEDTQRPRKRERPDVDVRPLELEDLPAVFALGERLFTADRWPTLYRTWDEYELVGFFQSDGDTCLVAEFEGRVVGFALGSLIEKRRGGWSYGYLIWLGVDDALGRMGIGSRLVKRLKDTFIEQGARMMLVDTDGENERAIAFFKAIGFGNEQPHVYLTKNLTQETAYKRMRGKTKRAASRRNPPPVVEGRLTAPIAALPAPESPATPTTDDPTGQEG